MFVVDLDAIGIALKKTYPSLSVYLSDISADAVNLAARNASSQSTCEVTYFNR